MNKIEYVIVGDTEKYKNCLIYAVGTDLEHAKNILNRMLNNPNRNDAFVMKGHTNIRIETVNKSEAWWNW